MTAPRHANNWIDRHPVAAWLSLALPVAVIIAGAFLGWWS